MNNIAWLLKLGLREQAAICLDDDHVIEQNDQNIRIYKHYSIRPMRQFIDGKFNGVIVFDD